MRISVEQAARDFAADEARMRAAIAAHGIHTDAAGRINAMMAQALARFTSDEFRELFGERATPAGREIAFLPNGAVPPTTLEPVGATALGTRLPNVIPGGREFYQVGSLQGLTVTDRVGRVGLVVRKEDASQVQLLADAYMLGDSRIRQAVREALTAQLDGAE